MLAVVRVRGGIGVSKKIKDTLKLLRLKTVNQMVVVPENNSMKGMVKKIEDFVTFGEISEKTLARVLEKRGMLEGNKKLGGDFLKEKKFKNFEEIANSLIKGEKKLKDLKVKQVFRLRPPKKGFGRKGVKTAFCNGGALGYRGNEINNLIERMI